jgi:hypothetical protein
VRTKDSCWCVGTIYDPRELPGVSTAGPGIRRGVTGPHQRSAGGTGLSGVHPDSVRCANGPRAATVVCAGKGRRSAQDKL